MKKTTWALASGMGMALCAPLVLARGGLLGAAPLDSYPRTETLALGGRPADRAQFTAGSGLLELDAAASATVFGAGDSRLHTQPSRLRLRVRVLHPSAHAVAGLEGDDLVLTGGLDIDGDGSVAQGDETGALLTGEILELGFFNAPGEQGDLIEMRFRATGGRLRHVSGYEGREIRLRMVLERSGWADGHGFDVDFGEAPLEAGRRTTAEVFPVACGGRVGDLVFDDLNGNGIQDDGVGSGLDGVTLTLTGTDVFGESVSQSTTTTTQAGRPGFYQFTGLCESDQDGYALTLRGGLPAGYAATGAGAGTPATDSSTLPAKVVLQGRGADLSVDFGYRASARCTGHIGDRVFFDANGNGLQDGGEPGIEGVEVALSGAARETQTTRADGAFLFGGLCAGEYTLEVAAASLPPGFSPTLLRSGPAGSHGSKTSPWTVDLVANDSFRHDVDFGFLSSCSGTIGDRVWLDRSGGGVQGSAALEPGLGGVSVFLRSAGPDRLLREGEDDVTTTTTTDAGGRFRFPGLCAGKYSLSLSIPGGLFPTAARVPAGTPSSDSGDPAGPVSEDFFLPYDQRDNTRDFGLQTSCGLSAGGRAWHDLDKDGIQDPGEHGIAGVLVTLFDATNLVERTTVTGPDGLYTFGGVCPDPVSYRIEADAPHGMIPSPPFAHTGGMPMRDSTDSDGLPSNAPGTPGPSTATVRLLPYAGDSTLDFGFHCSGSIGNLSWNDLDRNGIQDAGEPGLAGIILKLVGIDVTGHSVSRTTTTAGPVGPAGQYEFTGLCAGTYEVEALGAPAGFVPTQPFAPSGNGANPPNPAGDSNEGPATVSLGHSDSSDHSLDFGYVKAKPRALKTP